MDDLIKIKLYYKIEEIEGRKRLIILDDEKAEELLKDEEKAKGIEIVETEWKTLTWEGETIAMRSSIQAINPMSQTGGFDFYSYRDKITKKCLIKWNLTKKNEPVPVTPENINELPSIIVLNLYNKFDSISNYSSEQLKK